MALNLNSCNKLFVQTILAQVKELKISSVWPKNDLKIRSDRQKDFL